MYTYSGLRTLHLEVTQRCNAGCPQCSRYTSNGLIKPTIPQAELYLEDVKHCLPIELLRQLTFIYLCGNYGDPIVAQDTLPILQYFREENPDVAIRLHTNGAARTVQWWQDLARLSSSCIFGIDGLEDTNHLYRIGTSWRRIMENAAAYINAGGVAEWQFLVFKHNEHQINEARRLSEKMGFRRFFVMSTTRFYSPENGEVPYPVSRFNRPLGYSLQPVSRAKLRNAQIIQLESQVKSAHAYENYLVETEIQCKAIEDSSIYLSAEGLALPCCWMSLIYQDGLTREESEIGRIVCALPDGFASIDAKKRSIKEIVHGDLFQRIIPSLWTRGAGRLRVCARKCGSHDVQTGQYVALQ